MWLPMIGFIKLTCFFSSKKVKGGYYLDDMSAFNILGGGNNIIVVCQNGQT